MNTTEKPVSESVIADIYPPPRSWTEAEALLQEREEQLRRITELLQENLGAQSQEAAAALAQLRESERNFRLLVQSVVDYAIYLLDPNGRISNWNAGAQRIKGYRAEEVIGRHLSMFFTPEDRAAGVPERALRTAREQGRFESEGWRLRKDGTRFWALAVIDAVRDERGELIGFAKITRDMTERKEAQEALRASERQFRLLVAGVTDYAIYMLDPDGRIANWNAGAERIKGYRRDEIVGDHFSRFFTAEDRAAGLPQRVLETARREGRYESEGWRLRKDGTRFWANAVVDAVHDETGALMGFAKITRDITERREAQLALQRAHEQLVQTQKMEALSQLTGGIAHDFNNLLMIVSGQAEMLKRRSDDPKAQRALDAITLAAKNGANLTRQLLTFSRRQNLNPVSVDLHARLGATRELLASSAGSQVQFEIRPDDAAWPVEVDLSEFELALVNLVVNARDAMPQGGRIIVTAENRSLSDFGAADLSGAFVAVSVTDTGTGIDPAILPKVFDPFFTTKGVGKGTGLGLSQVFGFARQSGGEVEIESKLGVGTRVTMMLPRARAGTEGAEEQREAVRATRAGTILIVEDNAQVSQVSQMLLGEVGYDVVAVDGPHAALALLEKDNAVDLVFSDIVMPGEMDGIALAEEIRRRFPELPVLLTSGYSNAAQRAEALYPILRKPYELSGLAGAVKSALERAR